MLDDTNAIAAQAVARPGRILGNRLLASFPAEELAALSEHRAMVEVVAGQILLEPEEVPTDVLFPSGSAVLTALALLPDRKPVESAMIGSEGATGALFGPIGAPFGFRLQVLIPGHVTRIPAKHFGAALDASPAMRAAMARYATAQMAQLQIGIACAALHPVEERTARWLLDLQARTGERSLPLTQEALADLLGVRRTTITRVIATLEDRGLVRHRRGRIIVMDRAGLEEHACACHQRARAAFEAAAPGIYPERTAG